MVGLDAVVAYTDELERQLARLESLPRAEVDATAEVVDRACRKLRIFLDELVKGVAPVPLKLFPEYEAMQLARGAKAASPTELFYPDLTLRPPRIAPREPIGVSKLPSYLVEAAPHLPARPAHVAAGRRRGREDDARGGRRHRGRDDAGQPEVVLVERRRAAGGDQRERARPRLRRQAARRPHRPADPPRGRGQREGGRPAAPRGALLRGDQRTGGAAGPGGAAYVPARGADPDRRGAQRRPRAHPAAPARGARAARAGEGRLAQVRLGARREPAQAEGHAHVGPHEGGRGQARRADEAHLGAGRAARPDADRRRVRDARDGIRDGAPARRERVRELHDAHAGLPEAGRHDALAPRRGAGRPPERGGDGAARSTR